MFSRSLALALSATLAAAPFVTATASAQTPATQPSPAPAAQPTAGPMTQPTAPPPPGTAQPGSTQPSSTQPGSAQPSSAQPTTAQPGTPGTPGQLQGQPQPVTTPGAAPQSTTVGSPPQTAPTTTRPGTTTPATTQQQPGTTVPGTSGTATTGTGPAGGTAGGSAPNGVAAPGAQAPGSNIRGAGLPPPPLPPVLPAVPNLGMQLSAPVSAAPNPDLVGVNQQPFVGLTLQDAIVMALQRNTQLAVSQSNRRIANYQIIADKGAYDVNFQLVPSYEHTVQPVISPFNTTASGGPVTQDTAGATASLRGLTQQGGQYTVGVTATRVTNDSAYNSYNPFYETAFQLAFTQPLGRGRSIDQTRLQIQLAGVNSTLTSANALQQASGTIVQLEDAYYDLVSAWQNVGIQEEGLRQASAQAASNARLAAHGAIAPTDIVEANTQVDVFQDNVYAAIQNVQRVQQEIKQLILSNPADPVWMANLVPTTPVAQIPQEPSLDALVNQAIRNRPEIVQVRAQRQQADFNLAFAKDQLKPQIDLGLGYTSNGFAGNPLSFASNPLFSLLGEVLPPGALSAFPPPPSYQTGKLGQSFLNALDNRFPDYRAQLTFSFPIGQHTAKADYAIAQEQQRQVQLDETAVVQRIRSEAVNAIQGLREAQYRVLAARSAREAAERVLLGEQRRFAAGTSTTFLVLQRQLDVANQRGRELQAQTDLDKAIVELNRVSGAIFAQNGIDVQSVGLQTLNAAGTSSILPPVQNQPAALPSSAPVANPLPRPPR
ncbi:MAG TPA: TolC family protein [Candidatus Baltobacteraceae bacterium]|nr:TolC family protein [Candidatus Baltobacteraceae bacterium]